MRVRVRVGVGVRVATALTASRVVQHAHSLVEDEEGCKAEEDGAAAVSLATQPVSSPNNNIPLLVNDDGSASVLAEECVRDEVEEDVAEEAAGSERDHGVEAAGLEVGRHREEDEVGDG